MSELWQASKLLSEAGLNELSPIVIHWGQHFYINKLMQCQDRQFVIPICWIKRCGAICVDVFRVVKIHAMDSLHNARF